MLHRGGSSIRGSEQCLIENASALSASGVRVVLARNDQSLDEAIGPFVERIIPFEFPELMVSGLHAQLPILRYIRQLRFLMKIVETHKPNLLWANGGLPCQLAVPISVRARLPLVCHFHHPASRTYMKWWMLDRATQLVFPSQFTASVCWDRIGRRGEVIYNGVDTNRFSPELSRNWQWRRDLGLPDDAVVFGQVSALQPHKRHKLLIEAVAAASRTFPNIYLVLVGSGPEKHAIERHAGELGVEGRVRVAGYVADTLPFYQHVFDVNVLASSEEGLGISALEGAACGLPCIVADGTGLREAVVEDVTAVTFPVDDLHALTQGILHLTERADERERLGRSGRVFVRERFDRALYRSRIVELVRSTLAANGT